ncbi:hypothetical protein [Corynebacterium timonense]|nr:hypothetical protein [Corynebacterium timonense]
MLPALSAALGEAVGIVAFVITVVVAGALGIWVGRKAAAAAKV